MIVGFYISLRHPSAYTLGQCLVNCILRKETYLEKLGVKGIWPVWGFPRAFHADNGKDFRGEMLRLVCNFFGKDMIWRALKTPEFGGHIERLIGTAMKTVHTLPGTTFSNTRMKNDYDSEKESCLIIDELEQVFCSWVVNEYNLQRNEGIKTSPILLWQLGITKGVGNSLPTGLPEIHSDTDEFRRHFLPVVKRTIQGNGITIDRHIYDDHVLNAYIKNPPKKRWIFRTNPDKLEEIYFWDDQILKHFTIPLKNTTIPNFSKEDLIEAKKELFAKGVELTEDTIQESIERRRTIVSEAKQETKRTRKMREIARRKKPTAIATKPAEEVEQEEKNNQSERPTRRFLKLYR